ncbi:MAG: hypothetical protein NXI10_05785 [bacterium]|nr:hypothetical protein [bacterium]
MKQLLFGLLLCLTFHSAAQDGIHVPRNEVNFEHGYMNRGLIGVSYGRNFAKKEKTYFSVAGSAGLGLQIIDASFLFDSYPIQFFGVSPSFQYGVANSFISLGLEFKGVTSQDAYNGVGVGYYAGWSYNGPKGLLFKLRLGATSWSDGTTGIPYYEFAGQRIATPMIGLSIGFSFGEPL